MLFVIDMSRKITHFALIFLEQSYSDCIQLLRKLSSPVHLAARNSWALSIPPIELHFWKFPVANGMAFYGISIKVDILARYTKIRYFRKFPSENFRSI